MRALRLRRGGRRERHRNAFQDLLAAPFAGEPLGTHVEVANCLLLEPDLEDLAASIDVHVIKALDTELASVDDVQVGIENLGCDRFDEEACNCYVRVTAESPVRLVVVEALVDVADGDCGDLGAGFPVVARADAGVEEQCDYCWSNDNLACS